MSINLLYKTMSNKYKKYKEVNKVCDYKERYSLEWVLIDFVNIVVHIFNEETREYYALERLWADGKITMVNDKK